EQSWLSWLDQHYQSDFILTAAGSAVTLLSEPPIADDVAELVRQFPGIAEVQALRSLEFSHGNHPTILLGMDRVTQGLPLISGRWEDVAPAFWDGRGVAISENLARVTGLATGQTIPLSTPTGLLQLPILAVFSDYQSGGDLGCVAIARRLVQERWQDHF